MTKNIKDFLEQKPFACFRKIIVVAYKKNVKIFLFLKKSGDVLLILFIHSILFICVIILKVNNPYSIKLQTFYKITMLLSIIMLLIYIFYFKSKENKSKYNNLIIMFFPILLSSVIFTYVEFSTPKIIEKGISVVLLQHDRIISNKIEHFLYKNKVYKLMGPYFFVDEVYSNIYDNLNKEIYIKNNEKYFDEEHKLLYREYSFDIFELVFFYWMTYNYFPNWLNVVDYYPLREVDYNKFYGIVKQALNFSELKQKLNGNKLINLYNDDIGYPLQFGLPEGMRFIVLKHDIIRREYLFYDKYCQFNIKIMRIMNYYGYEIEDEYTIKRKLVEDSTFSNNSNDFNSFDFQEYKVIFFAKFNGLYKNSPESIARQIWIKDLINRFYNIFSWSKNKMDIEKALEEE